MTAVVQGVLCLDSKDSDLDPTYFMVQAYNKLSRTHCLAIHKAFQRDTSRYAYELESGGTVVKFPYRKADFGTKRDVTIVTSLVSATLPVPPLNSLVM